MELQKRIRELEEEINTMKQNFADAQEKLMAEQRAVVKDFET